MAVIDAATIWGIVLVRYPKADCRKIEQACGAENETQHEGSFALAGVQTHDDCFEYG
jgi:hypothetical protein